MSKEVPLLNEYKQEFFWKRFPQTLLGGPKLRLGYSAPAYVYINQVIVFLLPWLLGGIFTIVVELGILPSYIGFYVYGSCMIIYVLTVQLLSFIIQRRATKVASFHNTNILAEEDEVEFDSCCGYETFQFVVPTKRHKINILFHALVSGPLGGLGFWYLLPSSLNAIFGNNTGATIVLFIFGWLALCIAQYPLTVGSPPEPALFRATDGIEILPLLRPFYSLVCFCVHLAWSFYPASLLLTNQVLHCVFTFFPVLWCSGTLPPLDALLLWLLEQVLVHFLGGSHMAGDIRLCLMFVASLLVAVVAYFLPSSLAVVVFSACLGYVLSLDLSSLANQITASIQQSLKNRKTNHSPSHKNKSKTEQTVNGGGTLGLGWRWGWREIIINVVMVVVVMAIVGISSHFGSSASTSVVRALGFVVISLTVVTKILGDSQRVFVLFGLLRNKLFPDSINNTKIYSSRKKKLHYLGYIRRLLIDLVCPYIMAAYLGITLAYSGLTLPSVWFAVGAVYSLRKVWQCTSSTLMDVSILHILRELILNGSITVVAWWPLDVGQQLILIGLFHSWTVQILDKLYCYVTVLVTSYTLEKQRRKSSLPIIVVSLIFFPIVLATIVVSSMLSAPILPVFTLPLFLVGFPRPLRAWPGVVGAAANVCADSMYYGQLEKKLAVVLRRAAAEGSLGDLSPGSYLLVRFQDRMAWLQVLECGYGFCTISIKGMELQETSCHTVEAARLDDIFEAAFVNPRDKFPVCSLNQFPMHTLTPVDCQPVDTYSDARNVLTGIIDSPYTLELLDACFIKTLIWLLVHHNSEKRKDLPTPSSSSGSHNSGAGARDNGSVSSRIGLMQTTKVPNSAREMTSSKDSGRPESIQSRPPSTQQKQQPKRKSLVGSWHSLDSWNDNDSLDLEPMDTKPKLKSSATGKKTTPLPGAVTDFSDEEEDILKEFDFGLPAVDIHAPKKTIPPKKGAPIPMQRINLSSSAQFTSAHSSRFSLPLKWREIPMDAFLINPLLSKFPQDWYQHVIEQLSLEKDQPESNIAAEIAGDEALTSMYANLVMACYGMVNVFGLDGISAIGAGASHVYKVYTGDIPWSMSLDWLTSDEELHSIVIKAYRYAFKLAYDQMVLGEATDAEELVEYLQEYETEWYIGKDTDDQWAEMVKADIPSLFSLVYDANENTYNGRLLSRRPVMVHIGRLNPEVVRSLWSSLSLELFYFTNDDEERYSIQAHPITLRNLTIQAADPPLGYPIYASQPLSIPTW